MTTEILRGKLLPDAITGIDDPTTPTGQAWRYCIDTVINAQGVQRLSWGREIENPDFVWLFNDWDSVEAHKNFEKAPAYDPFIAQISTVIDLTAFSLFHVPFAPHPAVSAFGASVTEILTASFPADYADHETWNANVDNLLTASGRGFSGGWSLERDVAVGVDDTKEKGRVYVAVTGWEGVVQHEKFRGEDGYTDNIGRVGDTPGLKGMNVVHVKLNRVEKREL